MSFRFFPISSGSCGNAIFIECDRVQFLIDCGCSGITIKRGLALIDRTPSDLSFILVTHAHADHTSGIGVMARKYRLPICASTGTWELLNHDTRLGEIPSECRLPFRVDPEIPCLPSDIKITAFSTPHDVHESVGYRIDCHGRSAAVVTDLGYVSLEVKTAVLGSDLVLLESNHDLDMLQNGGYPAVLKKRVAGNRGHLSNYAAGRFAVELVRHGTKQIYLGHLSGNNNTPELAFKTVTEELRRGGIDPEKDVIILMAKRGEPSAAVCW